MIVRKRDESSGPEGDSVYFTAPAAFAVGRLERWRTSRLRNSHGEEMGRGGGGKGEMQKEEGTWLRCRGKIAGLLDAGVFRRYRRDAFFYCVVALSFSPRTHPLRRSYKSTLRRYGLKPRSLRRSIC